MHIDPVTAKPLLRPYYAGGPSNDSRDGRPAGRPVPGLPL